MFRIAGTAYHGHWIGVHRGARHRILQPQVVGGESYNDCGFAHQFGIRWYLPDPCPYRSVSCLAASLSYTSILGPLPSRLVCDKSVILRVVPSPTVERSGGLCGSIPIAFKEVTIALRWSWLCLRRRSSQVIVLLHSHSDTAHASIAIRAQGLHRIHSCPPGVQA